MTSSIEIFEKKPEGFIPQVEVSGCYIEIENKLLLLKYAQGSESGRWGVPAGKVEGDETPIEAAKRELFEETGISLECPSQIHYVTSIYVRKPSINYTFHLFKVQLNQRPDVKLSPEHQAYSWTTFQDIEEMLLTGGAMEALQYYRAAL